MRFLQTGEDSRVLGDQISSVERNSGCCKGGRTLSPLSSKAIWAFTQVLSCGVGFLMVGYEIVRGRRSSVLVPSGFRYLRKYSLRVSRVRVETLISKAVVASAEVLRQRRPKSWAKSFEASAENGSSAARTLEADANRKRTRRPPRGGIRSGKVQRLRSVAG